MTIDKLLSGFKQFNSKYFSEQKELYDNLVKNGQKPKALVIACSDSRVDPSHIFNAEPGEIFVIRNVANIVPPFETDNNYHGTSAAIEFAIKILQIKDIIILGHSNCAGIRTLVEDGAEDSNFIANWVKIATHAKLRAEIKADNFNDKLAHCEHESILISMQNLLTFPWLNELYQENKVNIHGWYFDMNQGKIEIYDAKEDKFLDK